MTWDRVVISLFGSHFSTLVKFCFQIAVSVYSLTYKLLCIEDCYDGSGLSNQCFLFICC